MKTIIKKETNTFYRVESTEKIFSPPSFNTLKEAQQYIKDTPKKGNKEYYTWYATTLYINKVTQVTEKIG
jgi:hypothetical protein